MKKSEVISEKKINNKKKPAPDLSVGKVFKTVGLVVAVVIFGSVTLITALVVTANVSAHRESAAEIERLRDIAEGELGYTEVATTQLSALSAAQLSTFSVTQLSAAQLSALDIDMRAINPDFVGWISIDGTNIDYPVVRGADNVRYLTTSFEGQHNMNGALFMDFRNFGDIASLPNIIIYGHNSRQGGMFSDLHSLLSSSFLEENNIISMQAGNEILEFTIFSARLTTAEDPAYFLDFSTPRAFPRFANRIDAPIRAMQIITLSTCTDCSNDNARLVVQGYR